MQPVTDRRPNVILTLRDGAARPHLLFKGHTDTDGVAGMTVPPFDPLVREDRFWGRGAARGAPDQSWATLRRGDGRVATFQSHWILPSSAGDDGRGWMEIFGNGHHLDFCNF